MSLADAPRVAPPPPVPRAVWLLGSASLLTDAATEMIYPLLPVYLSRVLGAGPLSLGLIEGAAEAVNSLLKIASGWLSDRRSRRPIVIAGYTISSLVRPLVALSSTWPQVLLIRVLDRTGKGIRGAPRDAMLARLATPATRGRVFGLHRAMDHAGAVIGPLLATAILLAAPAHYRLVFALAIVPGALAVAVLFLVPRDDAPAADVDPAVHPAPAAADTRRATPLPRTLYAYFGVLFLFSLGNSADAFLLLRLADVLGGAAAVPLLWAALHVVKASLSTWGGTLSDRIGRKSVIVLGWGVYAVVYLGFALSSSAVSFVGWFLLYGVFFALTEGAEKALVADLTPAGQQGTAFGVYNAVQGGGLFAASVIFGWIYDRFSPAAAFGTGAVVAAAAALCLVSLRTGYNQRLHAPNSGHQ